MRARHLDKPGVRRPGFTLIELLAAMAVLALLSALLLQMVGAASDIWRAGKREADVRGQGRVILGLIERDLRSMVLRRDVPAFVDESGKAACAFYCGTAGGDGDRAISLVHYQLEVGENRPRFVRRDLGMNFTGENPKHGETGQLSGLAAAAETELGNGVAGFSIQFLRTDGQLVDSFACDLDKPDLATNIRAVVVSLLVVDSENEMPAGSLKSVETAFSGTPVEGETYAQMWRRLEGSASFWHSPEARAIPAATRRSLQVFERRWTLPQMGFGS